MTEAWMFSRGTLKAHIVKDGIALCGSGRNFEPGILQSATFIMPEKCKCLKCLHKLELLGSGTK